MSHVGVLLRRISDRWHLCFPEATKAIRGDQHTFMQLYLVPHTCKAFQEGLKQVKMKIALFTTW